jgi:RNA-binding protein
VGALRGSDRRLLRGLANPIKAVVQVGEAGLVEGVLSAVDRALWDHELVKVRIAADREERRDIAARIAEATRSELAGLVGRVAIFYRPAADPEDRKIRLPSSNG